MKRIILSLFCLITSLVNAQPPCQGIVNDSAWQMCWGDQSAIVFEWWTDTLTPGCSVIEVHYGNEQGMNQIFPGFWPSNNGYNNFTTTAGNGQMPPNWSVEHFLVLEFTDGTLSDTIKFTPTSCIEGCIDPSQIAYNPWATIDDGSCNSTGCDPIDHQITVEITLDNWPGETSWILTSQSDGGTVAQVTQGSYGFQDIGQTYTYTVCIDTLGVELIINDSYGDGLNGTAFGGTLDGNVVIYDCNDSVIWQLGNPNFGHVAYSGVVLGNACGGIPTILGCTDPAYQEFNPLANTDDGSCLTPNIFGCTDTSAYNYNPAATMMQFTPICNYTLIIEDDAGDGWGNSYLGIHQNGNLWTYTMGPGPYNQIFNLPLTSNYPVEVYYFEVGGPQQPPGEVEFQTWHNSFTLKNSYGDTLLSEGTNPFANNGQGALQPFEDPFYEKYTALPNCGNSCIPKIYGCMDPDALNYDPNANTDDGSCIPEIFGCTNPLAYNYDSTATMDDGSCIPVIYGCMDSTSWNYNPYANVDDGSCIYFGCTDSTALNYDPTANVDNGTCEYPIYGCTDPNAYNYNLLANVDDGSCIPVIYGCTDITMFNYDSTANTDNGTCIPVIFGCIDSIALNYDPNANTDNGSCILPNPGCTDPNAYNFDPTANVTDSTACLYDAGCIGDPGDPYWLNDQCYAWVINIDPYCCNVEWDASCQSTYDYCDQNSTWTDVKDLIVDGGIVIYPNPTTRELNIATSRVNQISITMYSLSGQIVLNEINSKTVDISHLETGVYFINVSIDGLTYIRKVIKQ
jgi:hypothetical protein